VGRKRPYSSFEGSSQLGNAGSAEKKETGKIRGGLKTVISAKQRSVKGLKGEGEDRLPMGVTRQQQKGAMCLQKN